ncbi:muts domain V-domain-containing protein [Aspergillus pseudoustus]|uniref:DNA mismatch repair protein MSH3 n=1 Tax=Aspergillus pseudoustus TaxID=1810923 RepID=A0ABR4L025_9EURO
MPLPSSQSSASSSPSLKRKQPTISSFFTKKPLAPQQSPNAASSPPSSPRINEPKEAENASQLEEDEDEDIVAPAPKRSKTNGFQPEQRSPVAKPKPSSVEQAPQPTSSQRTELLKFASSPAVATDSIETAEADSEEARQRKKERQKLHQKFVRKLGGADCAIGIGRQSASEATPTEEGVEGEDDEEAPPPVQTKGRAAGKKGGTKLTPMEKQIVEIKRKHMDTILLVEVGYKFRFFGEDARVAAKELSIVCIPGKFRYDEHPSESHLDRFASASIPVPRLHVHVKRLVSAGHKVGVVRQLETAALKAAGDNRNAPFVRKLTNVYTKSTYIDDMESLEASTVGMSGTLATGYILCLAETNARGWGNDEKVNVGIVAVQPTTGDIIYDDFEDGFMRSEIETRLLHIAPCELLIIGELSKATEKLVKHLSGNKTNVFGDQIRVERALKPKTAAAESHSHVSSFYARSMKSVDAANDEVASNLLQKVLNLPDQVTICLSAMIKHMTEYELEHVLKLTKYFQHFSSRSHMLLNGNTLTSLEIYQNQTDHTAKGSLFWTLDRTQTRFGQRMLRKWVGRPLLDRRQLQERINAVEELKDPQNTVTLGRIKTLLGKVKHDLEKGLIRIYYGKCSRPELLNILQTMQMIAQQFSDIKSPADTGFSSPTISQAIISLPTILDDVVSFLNKINMQAARNDDKYAFFREAEETEEISAHKLGIGGVEHELEEHRFEAGKALGKTKVTYSSVAGIDFLVEIENHSSFMRHVPASWVKVSGTKRVSRFHTPQVIRLIRQRDQHREALAAACDKAFLSFQAEIAAANYQTLRDCVQSLATLDCLISLATIANQPGYVKPEYTEETCIHVQQGRHPMVEQLLLDSYVPNDIDLRSDKTRALLVTGPNMGGKSSYVRQVALISIMGQIGSYVPAQSAKLGMLDAVFTRMGAFDNMLAGESTFMVELSETADILKQATPRSLVILDELGRGTSTHDGVAIAQAVLDYVVRSRRSLTLFITHYQHLSSMVNSFPDDELRNVHMRFSESKKGADEEITFLYEVGEGVAHRSYGLNVARLANLPSSMLEMAKEKSAQLEEKIRRRQLAGLVTTVGEVLGTGDESMIERLISGMEDL